MTSKEALEELCYYANSNEELIKFVVDSYKEYIEKDLEVLEKLKSILKVSDNDGYIGFYTDGYINNKEILEIKEWLENE